MNRGLARFVASLILAGVAVGVFVRWGPAPALVWQQISALSPLAWLLAVAGMLASYCLRAMRLHSEWHPLLAVSRRECLRVAVFHTAAINVLPMRSGEASYPLMLRRRWKVPLLRASLSLLWMRVQDISVVAMFTLFAFLPGPLALRFGAVIALASLAVFAWKSIRPNLLLGPAPPPPVRSHGIWRARLTELAGRVRIASAESRGGGRAWAYCVAIWVVKFSVLVALLSQLTGLSPVVALCGVLGGEFASALPVQPALGAGTYEAGVAFAAAYSAADLRPDSPDMIAAAIAVHLFMLVMSACTAALLFVTGRDAPPRVTTVNRVESPSI